MSDEIVRIGDTPIEQIIEPRTFGKQNVILDATVFTTIMACARLGDFKFNMNLVSINGKSNSLECGSIVHKFLEYYHKALIKGVRKEQAVQFGFAAAELYIAGCKDCTDFIPTPEQPKPKCEHQPNEFEGVRNTPRNSEGYKIGWQDTLDTCDQYIQFWKNDHWVTLEAEVVKGEVLYEDDEIRILWKAKFDWIADTNQGIFPVDHKTMKQRRETLKLNNQFMGQCLLMKTRNVFINKIGFQKTLEPKEKFTRPPVSYSAAALLEWQSETLPYYAKLLLMYNETGHFPPNYTHCENKYGNCPFLEVCQSNPNMRESELKRLFKVGPVWDPTSDED